MTVPSIVGSELVGSALFRETVKYGAIAYLLQLSSFRLPHWVIEQRLVF